ncbi:MAG: glycosyltransferase family 1 protein, partial [Bryobacterales bacterium]|nr:glycosyltransferase family 4 protein [Bryobacteraceae bacterium]MDW8130877.1 glycosyltransferase family 1 protein [Bryobacterales bacterium]
LIPGGVGGTEIYLRSLLGALAENDRENRYVVFACREAESALCPPRENFRFVREPVPARLRPARLLWEQTVLPLRVAQHRLDVLLNAGFTAPVFAPCPSVTVFHDLQYKRHPEYFRWFDLPFWRLFLWLAARRSRLVLADSEATRADFLRYYRLPAERVRVVPLGVDPFFFTLSSARRPERSRPFILCVSTLHPHKNLDRLLGAFARLRRGHPHLRLVVAGMRGFHADALERRIAELGLRGVVELTGWIPRDRLYELYRTALAFVYPSEFEGFGLPVLEALAAGLPTACSNIEPLASLAGDAALLFEPHSEEQIAESLRCLLQDEALQRRLSRLGPERAACFSWRRTAELTLAALCEAARG